MRREIVANCNRLSNAEFLVKKRQQSHGEMVNKLGFHLLFIEGQLTRATLTRRKEKTFEQSFINN